MSEPALSSGIREQQFVSAFVKTEHQQRAQFDVMPAILVCGDALALFKAEQDAGAAPTFLMKKGVRGK